MPDFVISILTKIGVVLLVFAAGYSLRWAGEAGRVEKALRQQEELAQEDMRHRQRAATTAATQTEKEKERVRTEFKFIDNGIDLAISLNPTYLLDCIDDAGLRLWNGANEGKRVDVQRPDVDRAQPREAPAAP